MKSMINIYDVISSTMRNHPLHDSTMSKCPCDRNHRRGGEPCLECIKEALLSSNKITEDSIDIWFETIRMQNSMTRTIIRMCGEDMKFDSLYNIEDKRVEAVDGNGDVV